MVTALLTCHSILAEILHKDYLMTYIWSPNSVDMRFATSKL